MTISRLADFAKAMPIVKKSAFPAKKSPGIGLMGKTVPARSPKKLFKKKKGY